MKKLWKKFDKLTEKCYDNMIGGYNDFEVWNEAFEVLMDIIHVGREINPEYAKELIALDEDTDFAHDICGWLEDYLDELELRGEFDKVLELSGKLLSMFRWEEDDSSDLRCRIPYALYEQGKNREALEFCEEWYKKETDNLLAAVALIHARMRMNELDQAEELVKKYISEDTECTDDTEIIFTAAAALYKEKGDKEAEERMNRILEEYEEKLEEELMEWEDEDDLPFC